MIRGPHPPPRARARLLPVLVCLGLAATLPVHADLWYEYYARGEQAINAQDWTTAVDQLTQAIAERGESGSRVRSYGMNFVEYYPYLKLGIAYYNLGRYDEALQAFAAEERAGAVADSRQQMQNLQTFRRLSDEAKLEAARSEQERLDELVTRKLAEARILETQGNLDAAIKVLGDGLALSPEHPEATAALDRVRNLVAERRRAEDRRGRAAGLVEQGRSLLASEDYEEASSILTQALSLDPSDQTRTLLEESRRRLGERLRERQDAEQRRALVLAAVNEATLVLRPSLDQMLGEGDPDALRRRLDDALRKIESALAVAPDNAEARGLRERLVERGNAVQAARRSRADVERLLASGTGHLGNGEFQEALAAFNGVLALDPGNAAASRYLVQAFRGINEQILAGGAVPVLTRLPPTIELFNFRPEREGGEPIERTDRSEFQLEARIYDDQPEVQLLVERATSTPIPLTSTSDVAFDRLHEVSLAAEEKIGDNLYRFYLRHPVALARGVNTYRIVATDLDELTDERLHHVRYAIPWSRSPWLYGALGLAVAVLGGAWLGVRLRRRNQLLKRRFNPYVAGAPVLKDDIFFGRERLMARVLQTVHNNSILLYGERRIGKTSFQHRLKKRLTELNDPDFDFFPVYVDLQGVPEERFFATLATDTFDELGPLLDGVQPSKDPTGEGSAYDYRDFVRDVRSVLKALRARTDGKKVKLVLLIDEVDALNDYDPRVNQRLRSLFMRSFAEELVAVVSGVGIKKHWESEGSPWYNFFEEIEITAFQDQDARDLITRPIQGVFEVDKGVVDRIIEMTDSKPYLIQKMCVALVRRLHDERRRRIRIEDVETVGRPKEA